MAQEIPHSRWWHRDEWRPSSIAAAVVASLIAALLASLVTPFRHQSFDRIFNPYNRCDSDELVVYGQNRWNPVGAAIRATPSPGGDKVGSLAPNESAGVDGWVEGPPVYPKNPTPFDSGVWFHLADRRGWVSFGGVRANITAFAPEDDYGGPAAETPPHCEIDVDITTIDGA